MTASNGTNFMLVGYARISTNDQPLALQLDALTQAGRDRVHSETASGPQRDRPGLKSVLDYMRTATRSSCGGSIGWPGP